MSAHTPGPWSIEIDHQTEAPEFIRAYHKGEMFDIATLSDETKDIKANARLIAAAPDLLAALFLIETDKDGDGFICSEAMEQVRAAIAKAVGVIE